MSPYHFAEGIFRRHDPLKAVAEHCTSFQVPWPYAHETFFEEEPHERALTRKEVQAKIGLQKKVSVRSRKGKEVVTVNEANNQKDQLAKAAELLQNE